MSLMQVIQITFFPFSFRFAWTGTNRCARRTRAEARVPRISPGTFGFSSQLSFCMEPVPRRSSRSASHSSTKMYRRKCHRSIWVSVPIEGKREPQYSAIKKVYEILHCSTWWVLCMRITMNINEASATRRANIAAQAKSAKSNTQLIGSYFCSIWKEIPLILLLLHWRCLFRLFCGHFSR